MRSIHGTTLAAAAGLLLMAGPALAQDGDIAAEDGGIHADGWMGVIDARAAEGGQTVDDARFAPEGDGFRVTTGPATTFWSPENRATGDYTVSATFTEPEYMALNNHPHPYGIVVGGNDMGTDTQSYLYCAAYGSGAFIVRGFGPEPFQLNGQRPEEHDAVNQAAGQGEPVTQEIAVSVNGDAVECAINGTVVGSYDRADVVTDGRLVSTDGVYGIRSAHNTDAIVTDLRLTQH